MYNGSVFLFIYMIYHNTTNKLIDNGRVYTYMYIGCDVMLCSTFLTETKIAKHYRLSMEYSHKMGQ